MVNDSMENEAEVFAPIVVPSVFSLNETTGEVQHNWLPITDPAATKRRLEGELSDSDLEDFAGILQALAAGNRKRPPKKRARKDTSKTTGDKDKTGEDSDDVDYVPSEDGESTTTSDARTTSPETMSEEDGIALRPDGTVYFPKRKRTAALAVAGRRRKRKVIECPEVKNIADLLAMIAVIDEGKQEYKSIDNQMLQRCKSPLEDLNRMVGLESVKETVMFQILYYIQNLHQRENGDIGQEEYLHTVIYGPPGHGKTEVAKIIGRLYQSMKILSDRGVFKVAHRDDFIAEYLGQTAVKTRKLLESCRGGTLFIDEVYSLAPPKRGDDSYSKEALDTLTAFLSEHKNDICVIIAGYEDDVKQCFFGANHGLERRFPWVHTIKRYHNNELVEIYTRMIDRIGWTSGPTPEEMAGVFDRNKQLFKSAGGSIETFISKCKMFHSKRVFSNAIATRKLITLQDIDAALLYIRQHNASPEKEMSMEVKMMYM
jgi:hypothetical protein